MCVLVLLADGLHARRVGEVVVAVGESEAALQEVGRVVVGVVEAGRDPEAEEVGGVEVGVVEGVDVGAEAFRRGPRASSCWLLMAAMRGEVRLERGKAVGFDGGLVHVGGVEVGDLLLIGVGGGVLRRMGGGGTLGDVVDDAGDLLEGAIRKGVEDAERGAVRGQRGALDVGAVAVKVEVVARFNRGVHVGNGNAVSGGGVAGLRRGGAWQQ